MPWRLLKKASLSRPLCLGGKSKAGSKKAKQPSRRISGSADGSSAGRTNHRSQPSDLSAAATAAAADEFVVESFTRPPRASMEHRRPRLHDEAAAAATAPSLAYCPHCCSVVAPVGPPLLQPLHPQPPHQPHPGIRTNPWSAARMQKSLDSGICDELNNNNNIHRRSAAPTPAEGDDADDAAADMEVSEINTVFAGRRGASVCGAAVLEGVARRGYVPAAPWQAVAAAATVVAQGSTTASSGSSSSGSPTEFDSPAASSSAASSRRGRRSRVFLERDDGFFADQLARCRRELLLRALASVRDQLEVEMGRLAAGAEREAFLAADCGLRLAA